MIGNLSQRQLKDGEDSRSDAQSKNNQNVIRPISTNHHQIQWQNTPHRNIDEYHCFWMTIRWYYAVEMMKSIFNRGTYSIPRYKHDGAWCYNTYLTKIKTFLVLKYSHSFSSSWYWLCWFVIISKNNQRVINLMVWHKVDTIGRITLPNTGHANLYTSHTTT